MTKVSRTIDFILSRVVIFALVFIWMRWYAMSLLLATLAALGITVVISLVLSVFARMRRRKKELSAADKKKAEAAMMQFIYTGSGKTLSFFNGFLAKDYKCVNTGECLLAETGAETTAIFTAFKHLPLNPDEMAKIFCKAGKYSVDKLLIFTNTVAPATAEAARRLVKPRVVLQNAADTFKFMKNYDAYPEITVKLDPPKKRKKLKLLLAVALSRRNIKGYLLGALFLLVGSLFVRFNLYYMLSASAFLALALLCFVDFKFKREFEESKVI